MVKEVKEYIVVVRGNKRQKQVTIPHTAKEIKIGSYVRIISMKGGRDAK